MIEEFADLAQSTITSTITPTQTSLGISDQSKFPNKGKFHLLIDNEIIYCTSVDTTNPTYLYNVQRGVEGTTGVSHSNGSTITLVLTKETLDKWREDNFQETTWAGRPSVPEAAGRLIALTDSLYWLYDTGSDYKYFGPIRKLKLPIQADWTNFNISGANAVEWDKGALRIVSGSVNSGGESLKGVYKSLPTPPYSLAVCLYPIWDNNNFFAGGIGFKESGTGKLQTISITHIDTYKVNLEHNKWNSQTSYNSTWHQLLLSNICTEISWLKIQHDGTNLNFFYSCDGNYWIPTTTTTKTNFFTTDADQIVLFINQQTGSNNTGTETWFVSIEEGS